jgi:hypothetical protein
MTTDHALRDFGPSDPTSLCGLRHPVASLTRMLCGSCYMAIISPQLSFHAHSVNKNSLKVKGLAQSMRNVPAIRRANSLSLFPLLPQTSLFMVHLDSSKECWSA